MKWLRNMKDENKSHKSKEKKNWETRSGAKRGRGKKWDNQNLAIMLQETHHRA